MKPFLLTLALLPAGCALPPGYVWGLPTAYEPPQAVMQPPPHDPNAGHEIAALPPMSRAEWNRALYLQHRRDDIDWYNQQTGTVTQCIGARCW